VGKTSLQEKQYMSLADSYRNLNAKYTAMLMAAVLIFGQLYLSSSPKIISRERINATVTEVIISRGIKDDMTILVLKLANNKTCKVVNHLKYKPKKGALISLNLEIYDDGSEACVIYS